MGLAAVYGTVKNHGGAIDVYSEPGRGAAFKVYLPLAEAASEGAESIPALTPIKESARILVVDDEQTVRDLAARILRRILRTLGCKVTTCNNGAEAVEYYRKAWKQTDLVILDMVMPEMNGRETFLAMRRINPDIRALLSSGYSQGASLLRLQPQRRSPGNPR